MSDRITGLVLLTLAVAYGATASSYEAMIGDPLGPAMFPLVLAIPLGLFSVYLILRPDPEPSWARGQELLRQILTVVVFVIYAQLIEPLGFLLTTLLAVLALGILLGARAHQAGAAGLAISITLFVLFHHVLNLPLPVGPLGFLD